MHLTPCADPENFIRGPNFFSFLVDEWIEDPNTT